MPPKKRPAATRVPLPPMEKASNARRGSGKEKKRSQDDSLQHGARMAEAQDATPLESQSSAVSEGFEKLPASAVCTDGTQVHAQEPHTIQPKATAKPAPKKRFMVYVGSEPQEEHAVAKTHEHGSAQTPSMEANAGPSPSPSKTGTPCPEAMDTDRPEETVGKDQFSAVSEQSRDESTHNVIKHMVGELDLQKTEQQEGSGTPYGKERKKEFPDVTCFLQMLR